MAVIKHYFPNFIRHLSGVADPRQQGKIVYPAELMLWMGVLERLAGMKSNNEYEGLLKVSTDIEENIFSMPGLSGDELPSIDAFCGFLQKLHPDELHSVIRKMIGALDRKKLLSKLKTNDGYLLLAIDGVQTFPSQANFILVRVADADAVFDGLKASGILVKNMNGAGGLLVDCLRITIGTRDENDAVLTAFREMMA